MNRLERDALPGALLDPLIEWLKRALNAGNTVVGRSLAQDALSALTKCREALLGEAGERIVAPLEWSKQKSPDDKCHYTHCEAATPFGRILITWKAWKEHPAFQADEFPCPAGYLSLAAGDVNDAMLEAESAYQELVFAAAPLAALPGEGET